MQQKWDDIDRIIFDSRQDIEPSYSYNEKLMRKLENKEDKKFKSLGLFDNKKIGALSLILSGMLLMMVISTDFQYKLIETQYELRAQIMLIQYEYKDKIDIIKNIFGE